MKGGIKMLSEEKEKQIRDYVNYSMDQDDAYLPLADVKILLNEIDRLRGKKEETVPTATLDMWDHMGRKMRG